jgi:hypothetical protein
MDVSCAPGIPAATAAANRRWAASFIEKLWQRDAVLASGRPLGGAGAHRVAIGVIGGMRGVAALH